MGTAQARTFTAEQISAASGNEIGDIARTYSKRELINMIIRASGFSPEAVTMALNATEKDRVEFPELWDDRAQTELPVESVPSSPVEGVAMIDGVWWCECHHSAFQHLSVRCSAPECSCAGFRIAE